MRFYVLAVQPARNTVRTVLRRLSDHFDDAFAPRQANQKPPPFLLRIMNANTYGNRFLAHNNATKIPFPQRRHPFCCGN